MDITKPTYYPELAERAQELRKQMEPFLRDCGRELGMIYELWLDKHITDEIEDDMKEELFDIERYVSETDSLYDADVNLIPEKEVDK